MRVNVNIMHEAQYDLIITLKTVMPLMVMLVNFDLLTTFLLLPL